ncbi:hypothetical protein SESBI_50563 [Sesbania bispinosa]|nr:hypothetical protein SESBI_50563 [Sesbania bispinosa]
MFRKNEDGYLLVIVATAVGSSLTKLSHAKVVGIACDVCEPQDVQRLSNFVVNELGYIDIWAGH